MKAYITKYALSEGIQEVDAELCTGISETMIKYTLLGCYPQHAHKGEWFDSKEKAIADAESRRLRKIESLKKSIKKLEALRFEQ